MAAPVLRLRTPTGTGSERLPPKSANGSGANRRRGTRAAGRRRWRAGLPLVAITRVVARPKNKGKNKTAPQREKAGIAWASRWSGVTVRGDPTGCSASRWSAMGVVVLTAQNHFRLDRDRPSHGSRDRKGAMRERRSAFEFALLRNFAQNGARRGPVPGPFWRCAPHPLRFLAGAAQFFEYCCSFHIDVAVNDD